MSSPLVVPMAQGISIWIIPQLDVAIDYYAICSTFGGGDHAEGEKAHAVRPAAAPVRVGQFEQTKKL